MSKLFWLILFFLNVLPATIVAMPVSDNNADSALSLLLSLNPWLQENKLTLFLKEYEKAAKKYQEASLPLKIELYKRIGDIYYSIDYLHNYRKWNKWYRKVSQLDTGMIKKTSIAYRFSVYNKIIIRKAITIAIYCLYIILFFFFMIRILKNVHSFCFQFFIKHTALFLVIYVAMTGLVFTIDGLMFHKSGQTFVSDDSVCGCSDDVRTAAIIKPVFAFIRPTVPLCFIDISNIRLAVLVFFIGFIPVILSILMFHSSKKFHLQQLSQ